jgi:hypothetical protein
MKNGQERCMQLNSSKKLQCNEKKTHSKKERLPNSARHIGLMQAKTRTTSEDFQGRIWRQFARKSQNRAQICRPNVAKKAQKIEITTR